MGREAQPPASPHRGGGRGAVGSGEAVWFNRGTMSAAAPAPPAATPDESKSHPVSVAAPPTPPARTACVANFNDAAKAERAASALVALGVPADDVRTLTNLKERRAFLDGYRYDRPAVHTQAGVGAAIFGAIGAVMLSLGALILIPEPPAMHWFFIVAFTVGLLGACAGGFVGWWAFRPREDPQDPLSEKVAKAGPAVAVLDVDRNGPDGAPDPPGPRRPHAGPRRRDLPVPLRRHPG